ncbi:MAG: hypothetical protein A2729_04505 [Candidatus Buchananbacteria bacterium RIFCSPHIGHO2_01_FULL_39_14]|uniref:Response regulatory domain-containing protein n=2 Tax=Candidatus Buchananiibacteriota TaxID=1817903 RepID=A0A1G1YPM7_9BACT|nr:MAG: hypothetical protein A2729_04505 [Candidatus Buchananbacteria bacterium RIFCSPHIGHO2_01_FULL_39_14]OGY49274.1 MAG: hypothetical protein A3D39_03200 [Candidatus Buchananbacteria bacterium RIFCSPHIGHO2_02_FULL_39_17]OGY54312.1 MAG: hypothetical protein A2912_04730 [Candidatus Buchananbacteria bacterium RIFCSPLOWO2_01_FULL_40_23b]
MDRILLVDDNAALRELTENQLKQAGYEVVTAPDGQETFKILKAETQPFALVITDQKMPKMCGTDLLARLRKEGITTPVILVTGLGDEAEREKFRQLGFVEVIAKPIPYDQMFLPAVKKILGRKKISVLLVNTDGWMRYTLPSFLESFGFQVTIVVENNRIDLMTKEVKPDILVVHDSQYINLYQLLERLDNERVAAPFLVLTYNPDVNFHTDLIASGYAGVCQIHQFEAELVELIEKALAKSKRP